MGAWKSLCDTARFFAAHQDWAACEPEATVGVISDFAGANEFFGGELLNLLARAGQHYRILFTDKVTAASFRGLRAVIYADASPAPAPLREQILNFARAGGLLISHAKWGGPAGGPAAGEDHPRFALHTEGKGRIAIAKDGEPDPYIWANDIAVLVSFHRYDLVRVLNGGATASYYTMSPDRKRAIVHTCFSTRTAGPEEAEYVRVAGP